MEPFDIDKIIKAKLEESHDLHRPEIEAAKPFVWSAVQKNISNHRTLTWYHLAAAVVLLLISFSFILFGIQKNHRQELSAIEEKMNQLESNYLSQVQSVEIKDAQVKSLAENIRHLENKMTGLDQPEQVTVKEKIVYRRDTIYITQTEYITEVINSSAEPLPKELPNDLKSESAHPALAQNTKTDDVIFFGYRNKNKTQGPETVKLKIGSFASGNN